MTDAAATMKAERGVVKTIAMELGVPERQVYEVADGMNPRPLKAWWIPTICRVTGSFAVLDALEAQLGRVAFKLPAVDPHLDQMNREFCRTVKQFGEYIETNGDVLADGRIEAHELPQMLGAIDHMLADLAEYRALVLEKARTDAA